MEITATALQTVAPNGVVTFNDVTAGGSPSIVYRNGSGLVSLRGLTNQWRARFVLSVGMNVGYPEGTTATDAISVSVALNGEPLASTTMLSTPAAAEEFNNISRSVTIDVAQGCCVQVSVENTGSVPIDVQNAILNVERVA